VRDLFIKLIKDQVEIPSLVKEEFCSFNYDLEDCIVPRTLSDLDSSIITLGRDPYKEKAGLKNTTPHSDSYLVTRAHLGLKEKKVLFK